MMHNGSEEKGVLPNPDPALETAHQHQHAHLHHTAAAGKHLDEGTAYTEGTTDEPQTVPRADAMDDVLHRQRRAEEKGGNLVIPDAEKGDSGTEGSREFEPRRHVLSTYLAKYKIVLHLVIWLFFTG